MSSPPQMPDDLATFWWLTRRVASLMDRSGEAVFRRELGVSLAQFLVLSVVDAHPGPLNQQTIAHRLGLTKGTVSRQIDNAVAAGLMHVETSSRTRRENTVALTRTGTALVRRGDRVFHQTRQNILPDIDSGDMDAAIRVLTAMNSALDAPAHPADER